MIAGIILAAGKGSRFKADNQNKVAVDFHGMSPVRRAAETMSQVVDELVVVIGHEAESVKAQLAGLTVTYAVQHEQKGTGHACGVALVTIDDNLFQTVIVGNGDHMMFYTPKSIKAVLEHHHKQGAVATCVTSSHPHVSQFGFGRVLRSPSGEFAGIVEQKDASESQLKIEEFNSGLAVFDTKFARKALDSLSTNNAAGELYIVDLFNIALAQHLHVSAVHLPFDQVGIGINSPEDYQKALHMFRVRERKE